MTIVININVTKAYCCRPETARAEPVSSFLGGSNVSLPEFILDYARMPCSCVQGSGMA